VTNGDAERNDMAKLGRKEVGNRNKTEGCGWARVVGAGDLEELGDGWVLGVDELVDYGGELNDDDRRKHLGKVGEQGDEQDGKEQAAEQEPWAEKMN
jgi:hypothetical protein